MLFILIDSFALIKEGEKTNDIVNNMLSFNNQTSGVLLKTFVFLATQNFNNSDDFESNTLYYQLIGKGIFIVLVAIVHSGQYITEF